MPGPSSPPTLEPAADVARIVAGLRARCGLPLRTTTTNFSDVLDQVSDVPSAVVLAELVTAGWSEEEAAEPAVDDGRWLLAHVREQLASLDRFVERRLGAPFKPPSALHSAEAITTALQVARPESDAAARAIEDIARRVEQRLLALVRTLRRETARVRSELVDDLRRLGPRASFVERMDAALRRAISSSVNERDVALGALFADATRQGFLTAMPQSGEPPDAREVNRWVRRGFMGALHRDLARVVRAIAAEEHALLVHLVRAAVTSHPTSDAASHSVAADVSHPSDRPSDPEGVAA